MACGSSATDPLPYTAGYSPNATDRSNAMSMANMMSNAERAQQMSGVQQNGTANYNVFSQEDNSHARASAVGTSATDPAA